MILAICGLGGAGLDVLELARVINETSNRYTDFIFIDKNSDITEFRGYPSMAVEDAIAKYGKDEIEFVVAVGEPYLREKIYHDVIDAGYSLATLVYPSVHVPKSTTLGQGTVIYSGAFISVDCKLDENVMIQANSSIGHGVTIGKHSVVSTCAAVAGDCSVGEKTYVAIQTAMKQGVSLGDWVILGMGSVVHEDIPDEVIVSGNPAQVVCKNRFHRVFGLSPKR